MEPVEIPAEELKVPEDVYEDIYALLESDQDFYTPDIFNEEILFTYVADGDVYAIQLKVIRVTKTLTMDEIKSV